MRLIKIILTLLIALPLTVLIGACLAMFMVGLGGAFELFIMGRTTEYVTVTEYVIASNITMICCYPVSVLLIHGVFKKWES